MKLQLDSRHKVKTEIELLSWYHVTYAKLRCFKWPLGLFTHDNNRFKL